MLLSGCGRSLKHFPFEPVDELEKGTGLEIYFHSVCCFRVQWKETAFLSDPFFTHLSLPKVGLGKVIPDPAAVEPHLSSFQSVKAVVIGHSHHDHVLDLPLISQSLHKDATIYGSQTLAHMYANSPLNRPIQPVNKLAATAQQTGSWLYSTDKDLRILPIRSGHPNQYLFFHLYEGYYDTDLPSPPVRIGDFLEGETFAYLIDFLADDHIKYRLYIQTTSTGFPIGTFPRELLEERSVDVAILAMDCATRKLKGQPSVIEFLKPKEVFVCHYEDFFRSKEKPPREGVKVNLYKLLRQLENETSPSYRIPAQESRYLFL